MNFLDLIHKLWKRSLQIDLIVCMLVNLYLMAAHVLMLNQKFFTVTNISNIASNL